MWFELGTQRRAAPKPPGSRFWVGTFCYGKWRVCRWLTHEKNTVFVWAICSRTRGYSGCWHHSFYRSVVSRMAMSHPSREDEDDEDQQSDHCWLPSRCWLVMPMISPTEGNTKSSDLLYYSRILPTKGAIFFGPTPHFETRPFMWHPWRLGPRDQWSFRYSKWIFPETDALHRPYRDWTPKMWSSCSSRFA